MPTRSTGRRRHHVDLLDEPSARVFSRTTIANTEVPADTLPVRTGHAVGGSHAGACVAFRRAQRNSGFQLAGTDPAAAHLLQSAYPRPRRRLRTCGRTSAQLPADILCDPPLSSNCIQHRLHSYCPVVRCRWGTYPKHRRRRVPSDRSASSGHSRPAWSENPRRLHAARRSGLPDTGVQYSSAAGYCKLNSSVSSSAACPVMVLRQVRNGTSSFSSCVKCHIAVHHGADAHGTNLFKRLNRIVSCTSAARSA